MGTFKDLTGKRFGKLTVVNRVENEGKHIQWLCKCDCGTEITTIASYLTSGHKTSCGCLRWQGQNAVHGYSNTKFYGTWQNMKKRCDKPNSPDYKNYGGRGIKYCDKWITFEGFCDDMKDGYSDDLTLDRIDVNGNYCKENCRWVSRKVQNNNTRANHYVTYKGETLTVAQLAEKYGADYDLVRKRISKGWDIEEAFKPAKELITYNGITKTVAEFAQEYGMTYHQLKKRLMKGWSIEKALTQPLRRW